MLKPWCLFSSNNISITEFLIREQHCMKSVRIQNVSGLYFPAFGLNTERYSVSLGIQSEFGKIWTRKTLWIWTLFTQCKTLLFSNIALATGDWVSIQNQPSRVVLENTQLTFTCSKSTTETLEKGVKNV